MGVMGRHLHTFSHIVYTFWLEFYSKLLLVCHRHQGGCKYLCFSAHCFCCVCGLFVCLFIYWREDNINSMNSIPRVPLFNIIFITFLMKIILKCAEI